MSKALAFYFFSDDFILLRHASGWTFEGLRTLFLTPGGDGFYRPVGALAFALDYRWASTNPSMWHTSALLIHALNSFLVTLIAAQLGASRRIAFVAGLLFAVHGTRPEAAAWIASRFDLLATFFTLLAFLLFMRACLISGTIRVLMHGLALLSMSAAILSKESAYFLPMLLAVYVIGTYGTRHQWRRASLVLVPYFTVTAAMFFYRWSLFDGIGGYVRSETGGSLAFSLPIATTFKAVANRVWAALYLPINWHTEPNLLLGVLAVLYLASLLWLSLTVRPFPGLLVSFAFLALALIPPLHLLVIGADLANSRTLYMPSAGFSILIAMASGAMRVVWGRHLVAASIIAFNVAALHHNLDSWSYASRQIRAACTVAADAVSQSGALVVSDIPGAIAGVPAFKNGFRECVELNLGHAADIQIVDSPLDDNTLSSGALILQWDHATDTLQPIKPPAASGS